MWDIKLLTSKLREATPSVLKRDEDGIPTWSYRGGPTEIKKRLETFTLKFPDAVQEYSEDDVLCAYKKYLEDTTVPIDAKHPEGISDMRKLLKYFIWKEKYDKTIESLLVKYLEIPDEVSVEVKKYSKTKINVNNAGNESTSWIDQLN